MPSALESAVERACKLLERPTPQAMEDSAAALGEVARELSAHRGSISVEQARRLRAGARRARFLLDLAWRLHARWGDILAGMSGGYTAQGAPRAFEPPGRLRACG